MKIKIARIENHGNYLLERVYLEVLEDCDIGEFLILDNTYDSDGDVSNKVKHPYWFPDKSVKKGDTVVLHTGNKHPDSGEKVHHFYWDLKESIWNDNIDAAILFHTDEWKVTKTK